MGITNEQLDAMNTVLAIDPGPAQSAYVVWDGSAIDQRGIVPNDRILELIRDRNPIDHACELLAVERVAHYGSGMPVGIEVFDTVEWSGRFIQEWTHSGRGFRRVFRREVKMFLCGSMKAKDANIRQALIDRYGPPGTKKAPGVTHGISNHLWAAFAIAATVLPGPAALERREAV